MFKIGQRTIAFEAPGEGGAGGEGQAAHPVAPWAESQGVWQIGEGDSAVNWTATIPEEAARAHVEAKGYRNPAELALANLNLTKLQRGDGTVVGLPGQDATPEDWTAFYGKLGRPDAPDGYEFQFAEGVTPDDAMLDFAKKTFHEAGLSPKQAQIVADKWNEFVGQTADANNEASEAQNTQALNELTTRWGADLDKNKAAGRRAVEALGLSAELVDRIDAQIGTAAIVELLATIGRKSDEGGFKGGGNGGDPNNPDTMSREQAAAKIAELQGSAEFQAKYTDRNNPGHREAVELMQRLYAKA